MKRIARALLLGSATLMVVLGGCDPFPDHPGNDNSYNSKHMRTADNNAFPMDIQVHYDCKARGTLPTVSFPHGIPGNIFIPKFESSQRSCKPTKGKGNNENCTQQVWKVSASYDCEHCSSTLSSRSMKDVPFGEIVCDCECAPTTPCGATPSCPSGQVWCPNEKHCVPSSYFDCNHCGCGGCR
jgi:hypothetical protein